MNVLIGDIGNTYTKICLVEFRTFKIKRLIYFNSKNLSSRSFLKNTFKKIIKSKNFYQEFSKNFDFKCTNKLAAIINAPSSKAH